jgi:hypothetical protein
VIDWTAELEDSIIDRLTTKSLRKICSEDSSLPDRATIQRHIADSAEFAAKCARARAEHARYRLEMVEDDVDTITEDNAKAVQVKVGFAQWLAARLLSKEYGDKLQLEGTLKVSRLIVSDAAPTSSLSVPDPVPEFDDAQSAE